MNALTGRSVAEMMPPVPATKPAGEVDAGEDEEFFGGSAQYSL